MKRHIKNLFPTTKSVVKKGTIVILCTVFVGLAVINGCEEYTPKEPDPPIDYPIEIPFTEYSPETPGWWRTGNLNYDNTVIIINSNEEMENYAAYWGNPHYPEIDFSTHSLLIVSGTNDLGVYEKEAKSLWQLSSDKYELTVELQQLHYAKFPNKWYISPLLVEKIDSKSNIKLNVTTSIVEMKVCGVDNPLTDLPWLKEITETSHRLMIFQHTYEDGIGFSLLNTSLIPRVHEFHNCEGIFLCSFGGNENYCSHLKITSIIPLLEIK